MENTISIISICATVVLGIVGFIINSCLQRKTNSIDIITRKRLERRDRLQELSAKILSVSDPDVLDNTKAENLPDIIVELTEACSDFRSLLEYMVKQDGEMISIAYQIKNEVVKYFDNGNHEKLLGCRRDFSHLTDLYFTTEWQRIKYETVGKSARGPKGYARWERLYEDNKVKFEENKAGHDDIYGE